MTLIEFAQEVQQHEGHKQLVRERRMEHTGADVGSETNKRTHQEQGVKSSTAPFN